MKVIYSKVCGVDVHKTFIVAVICDSSNQTTKYLKKRFSTFNNSLIEFRNWLIENDCDNVCMESTGKYYIPVYNALEGYISNVVVANPKWVKCIKGEKDDNKDAKWIADLFKLGIVRSSFIPSKDFRILREFTRYIYKLTCNRTSEKNRYTNALTVGNCKLDMVFSDIFGKSSQSIIDIIMNNDSFSDEDIINCLHKLCKSSHEDILSSVNGLAFTTEQKLRINIIKEHIDYLTNQINSLRDTVNTLVNPYENYINLLMTIPGIDRNSAITIISEIGVDMSQFSNHYRLSAWAGLAPGCNESAGKKKSVKISKRRGKKRAYIAIARKILVATYHMLSTGEVWNPTDLASVETSDKDRIRYTKNNFNQSPKQLLSLGLTSDELINLINQNAKIE